MTDPTATEIYPLTPSQEIIWLHEMLFPESRAYNFTATIDLTGELDLEALQEALGVVVNRHAAFRLGLVPGAALPRQRIAEQCAPRVELFDISGLCDPRTALEEIRQECHDTPFDLTEPPLIRWCLVRTAPRHHVLVHTEHHLVHDGRSLALVLRDLFGTYRVLTTGVPTPLPRPRPYSDYIRYLQVRGDVESRTSDAVEYYRGVLEGADLSPLPWQATDEAVAPPRGNQGGQHRQHIPPQDASRLRALSRRLGHTPYSTLFVLFCELLRRNTGRSDLVVGSAVGNRPPGFDETVGMFVNTIPLRVSLTPDDPASRIIDDLTDAILPALAHQDLPVQILTRELGLRSTSGLDNPLFGTMFSAHDARLPTIDLPGLEVDIQESFASGTSRFELDVVFVPDSHRTVNSRSGPGGLLLIWEYRTDLFTEESVRLLAEQLHSLLTAYLDDPERPLAQHSIRTPIGTEITT